MTLRGRIFLALFFALLSLASLWIGAWGMHAIGADSWMGFPISMTALLVGSTSIVAFVAVVPL